MYREKRGNLFENIIPNDTPEGVLFVQCISADLAMGAGIAVEYNRYFNTKNTLLKMKEENDEWFVNSGRNTNPWDKFVKTGVSIFVKPCVINMVTKDKYWEKPIMDDFKSSLSCIVDIVENLKITGHKIKEIRCPMIGCGIDKLNWGDVRDLLVELAADLALLGVDLTVIDLKLPVVGDGDEN